MMPITRRLAALAALVLLVMVPPPAAAQMLLTGAGRAPSGGGSISLVYRGHFEDDTDIGTYTVSAADIGTASADRTVIIATVCSAASARTLTSITLNSGAIAATVVVGSTSNSQQLQLAEAQVPTGTTADITVTFSSTMTRCAVEWWTITGSSATTYSARSGSTPDDFSPVNSITTPASGAITVPSGGVGIAVTHVALSTGGPGTWTQTSGTCTERVDERVGTSGQTWVSACDTAEGGGQAFTFDGADATNYQGAALTWGPT